MDSDSLRNQGTLRLKSNIPYLDGGLFDVHILEKQFEEIKIRDDAFRRIFNFFDQWNWH